MEKSDELYKSNYVHRHILELEEETFFDNKALEKLVEIPDIFPFPEFDNEKNESVKTDTERQDNKKIYEKKTDETDKVILYYAYCVYCKHFIYRRNSKKNCFERDLFEHKKRCKKKCLWPLINDEKIIHTKMIPLSVKIEKSLELLRLIYENGKKEIIRK